MAFTPPKLPPPPPPPPTPSDVVTAAQKLAEEAAEKFEELVDAVINYVSPVVGLLDATQKELRAAEGTLRGLEIQKREAINRVIDASQNAVQNFQERANRALEQADGVNAVMAVTMIIIAVVIAVVASVVALTSAATVVTFLTVVEVIVALVVAMAIAADRSAKAIATGGGWVAVVVAVLQTVVAVLRRILSVPNPADRFACLTELTLAVRRLQDCPIPKPTTPQPDAGNPEPAFRALDRTARSLANLILFLRRLNAASPALTSLQRLHDTLVAGTASLRQAAHRPRVLAYDPPPLSRSIQTTPRVGFTRFTK